MSLKALFDAHQGRLIDKWSHYFPIYERYFAQYVGKKVRVLEIGVGHGGSLQLWKKYFGRLASIWGLDNDPRCAEYEEDQIYILTGDQADPETLNRFVTKGMRFDIIIDDGSHKPWDQLDSFTALWPLTNGVYLIEDCHNVFPPVNAPGALIEAHPWVLTITRPKRVISGMPSRILNPAEQQAYAQHLHPHV